MNSKVLWLIAMVLMFAANTVYAGKAVQMLKCEMDDVTEEDVQAHASEWLAAAKKSPGGENLEAFVLYPVAVNIPGEMDFMFVLVAPSFSEWGQFMDGYPDSEASELDNARGEDVVCPNAVLWDSYKVE